MKILELLLVGISVIAIVMKGDEFYFKEDVVENFQFDAEKDFSYAMAQMVENTDQRVQMGERGGRFIQIFLWERYKQKIFEPVDRFATTR